MLHKTRGIVLKTTDYGETSVIAQVFTEKFGLQSYIINGVKKAKAKISRNMLQPLHLLDMVVYHKNAGSIQRVSELKSTPMLQTIPYDIVKSSIVMFLNEVIYKCIKQQTADENLFDFLFSAVEWLDHQTEGLANFHLLFLVNLTRYLGFYPDRYMAGEADYFDLKNGTFNRYKPDGLQFISQPYTHIFNTLLQSGFSSAATLKINNEDRRHLITKLLDYYALHTENFGYIRSHEVLEEVLSQ